MMIRKDNLVNAFSSAFGGNIDGENSGFTSSGEIIHNRCGSMHEMFDLSSSLDNMQKRKISKFADGASTNSATPITVFFSFPAQNISVPSYTSASAGLHPSTSQDSHNSQPSSPWSSSPSCSARTNPRRPHESACKSPTNENTHILIGPEYDSHEGESEPDESYAENLATLEIVLDPHSPSEVSRYVSLIIRQWGASVPIAAIHPDKFLHKILRLRGYKSDFISHHSKSPPTSKQINDYDQELIKVVRDSELDKLMNLQISGKSMSACNRYGESIVHMACRRSEFEIVDFILNTGGDHKIIDDYGRSPLHDAFWRPEPRFDVVTLILDRDPSLLLMTDIRGASPLSYVRQEHWLLWCAYFYHQKDKYWPEKRSHAISPENAHVVQSSPPTANANEMKDHKRGRS